MQHDSDRWMFAQFLPLAHPAGLFACPHCGHWAENGFAVLKEAKPGGADTQYSVYCLCCDHFGPKEALLEAAVDAWNWSSLTKTGAPRRRALAFAVSI